MNFLKKLFVRKPEDYLEKGNSLLASKSFYEARVAFEDGMNCCAGKPEYDEHSTIFEARISDANKGLAALNIEEAKHAIARGASDKAIEHLDLAITLTHDTSVREKAELLLSGIRENINDTAELAPVSGCSSCSHPTAPVQEVTPHTESELADQEYFELLILQLPEQVQKIYASLGEVFAKAYIAASHDKHQEALNLFESWFDGSHRDIYCYEKAQILHRLGKEKESESMFREAIKGNAGNPLPHLGLALLLIDDHRLGEALTQLERMIENEIFTGQALMMRGEVYQLGGDVEAAINQFSALLGTPMGHAAAENLYRLLLDCGRQDDAAHVFKKYLSNKCKH
jgi:tetratricopeptide (TPR) repeat protein